MKITHKLTAGALSLGLLALPFVASAATTPGTVTLENVGGYLTENNAGYPKYTPLIVILYALGLIAIIMLLCGGII